MRKLSQRLSELYQTGQAAYRKHGEILRYLVIGGLTTLIDIASFAALTQWLSIQIEPAKVVAWILAVSFAFAGNKWIVFQTKTKNDRALFGEAIRFFVMRLGSLGFALLFNHIAVRLWLWNAQLANLVSNGFVIVINYVLGKLFVFRQ